MMESPPVGSWAAIDGGFHFGLSRANGDALRTLVGRHRCRRVQEFLEP